MLPLWIPVSLTATTTVSSPAAAPAPAPAPGSNGGATTDEVVYPTRWTHVFPPPSEVNCTDAADDGPHQPAAEDPDSGSPADEVAPQGDEAEAGPAEQHCVRHFQADPVTVRAGLGPWLAKAECPAPYAVRFSGPAPKRKVCHRLTVLLARYYSGRCFEGLLTSRCLLMPTAGAESSVFAPECCPAHGTAPIEPSAPKHRSA